MSEDKRLVILITATFSLVKNFALVLRTKFLKINKKPHTKLYSFHLVLHGLPVYTNNKAAFTKPLFYTLNVFFQV